MFICFTIWIYSGNRSFPTLGRKHWTMVKVYAGHFNFTLESKIQPLRVNQTQEAKYVM